MSERNYKFYAGFKEVEVGKKDMVYIRKRGKQLAQELGARVSCNLHNEYCNRWEYVGASLPDGTFVNAFGDICKLDEDGRNYRIITHSKDVNNK